MSTSDLRRASSPNYQTWIATLPVANSHLVTTSSPMLQPAMRVKIVVWSWVHWQQWLRLRLRVASLCEEIVTSVNDSYNSDDTRVSTSCWLTELTTSSPMLQLAERVEIVVSSRLYQCRWSPLLVACLCSETDPPTAELTTFWQRCWPPSAVPCFCQQWRSSPWRDLVSTNGWFAYKRQRTYQLQVWRHRGRLYRLTTLIATTSSPTLQPEVRAEVFVWPSLHSCLRPWMAGFCGKTHPSLTVLKTPGAQAPYRLTTLMATSSVLARRLVTGRRVVQRCWVKKHVTKWPEDNRLIKKIQAGFREGYGKMDFKKTSLLVLIQNQLLTHRKLYAALIDRNRLWNVFENSF